MIKNHEGVAKLRDVSLLARERFEFNLQTREEKSNNVTVNFRNDNVTLSAIIISLSPISLKIY